MVQTLYFRRHFSEFQSLVYDYDHVLNSTAVDRVNYKIQEFYFGSESPETVSKSQIAQVRSYWLTNNSEYSNAVIGIIFPFL